RVRFAPTSLNPVGCWLNPVAKGDYPGAKRHGFDERILLHKVHICRGFEKNGGVYLAFSVKK
ncbi:MAG: hypothetical protein MJ041_00585, partial [Acidaminococcaceae bacterium]|nr:hypothetical protein [Acidaminococcaceae bacterium]